MNRGAQRLCEIFPSHGRATKLAEALGVHVTTTAAWFRGTKRPDTLMRAKLEAEYGIDWKLWDEPTEATEASRPEAS